jgi:hypothetical protein
MRSLKRFLAELEELTIKSYNLETRAFPKLYLGSTEKTLKDEVFNFIVDSSDLDYEIKQATRDVSRWAVIHRKGGKPEILLANIKRNRRLAQPAIDRLDPDVRPQLLLLLEEKNENSTGTV